MDFDRIGADKQLRGDLFIAGSGRHQAQDIPFTFTEVDYFRQAHKWDNYIKKEAALADPLQLKLLTDLGASL